jgi:membrane fusion protein, copper/silver efflux system
MKKSTILFLLVFVFVVGAAVPTFLVWNPGHWGWAEHLTGRVHNHGSASDAPGENEQLWTCGMHPQVIQDEPGLCPICNMKLTPLKQETAPAAAASEPTKQLWTCGMHPQVIQDEPGDCPICNMKLVPLKQDTAPAETAAGGSSGERKIKYWRAPMDPNYISDKPGKSPMGMDLVPVYEDEQPAATGVRVDPGFLQNFGVRTATVEKGSIPIEIRTIGVLTYNEKDIASVNTKFEGWIEKAYVNYIGEPVKKGQVLFEIYSPQLVTTQQEYLATLDYVGRLGERSNQDAIDRAKSLLEAARERLHYWDISDEQIAHLKQTKKATRTLKIFSPASGVVVEKMNQSLEGMKLNPGMNVFKIANLSTVWAEIEVYEYQLQHVRLGQNAAITVDAFPGRRWNGKIIYLDPTINQQTRTLRAFVEISNKDMKLRPEMFANVDLRTPAVSGAVKVPDEAILHTGDRSVVIVQKEKGVFEPRQVSLGVAGDGYQEVRHGLQAGETIVTSSQFLIDSESNLREAINKMLAERSGASREDSAPAAPAEHQH